MSSRAAITIVVQGWTGWTREQPKAKSVHLEVELGYKLTPATVGIASDAYEIAIDSIGSDRIIVTYTGVVMTNENGTINLTAPQKGRCMIQIQHCLSLATATMDGGTSIALTLDRIVA